MHRSFKQPAARLTAIFMLTVMVMMTVVRGGGDDHKVDDECYALRPWLHVK